MRGRPKTVAILLGGGQGRRAGGPKQFRRAGGRSLLEHSARGLLALREIGGLVVVVPASDVDRVEAELDRAQLPRWRRVVAGGATRHLSSRCGLAALPDSCERVLIHDAARPFASPRLVRRLLRALQDPEVAGVIPVIAVHDSTIELGSDGVSLRRYLDRARLRAVQTPQAFRLGPLREAFDRLRGHDFADDAVALRRRGLRVDVVAGEEENLKVTTADELRWALRELARRERQES